MAVVEYLDEFVGHRLLEQIAALRVDENDVGLPDFRVDFLGNNAHRRIVEEGIERQPVIFPHVNYEQMKTKALPRKALDVRFDCSFSGRELERNRIGEKDSFEESRDEFDSVKFDEKSRDSPFPTAMTIDSAEEGLHSMRK